MYDPKTARFLQEDTYRGQADDPLSLNLYTYCANNPITYWDPTGHSYIRTETGEFIHVSKYEKWKKEQQIKRQGKSIMVEDSVTGDRVNAKEMARRSKIDIQLMKDEQEINRKQAQGKEHIEVYPGHYEWLGGNEETGNRDTTMNYYDTSLPEYEVIVDLLPNKPINYHNRKEGSTIKAVVVHWTAAPNQKAENTRNFFLGVEASSHYILGPNGKVLQTVPNDKTAYANGGKYKGKLSYTELVYNEFVSESGYLRHNDFTISIETNPIDDDGNFSNETYTALVRLSADLLIEYNLSTADGLYRHHDFTTKDCPKVFVNPGESYQFYRNDEDKLIGVTPTSNPMWEQFKSDVERAMNR